MVENNMCAVKTLQLYCELVLDHLLLSHGSTDL